MEENKNLNPEIEQEDSFDIAEAVKADKKEKKAKEKTPKKPKKERLLKNEALFKKGGYSIAITAMVLAGIIVLNVLVGALADRFVLEFDMTAEKENSISQENIDYIKDIEDTVTVTICAAEDSYSSYMSYYASEYGVSDTSTATVDYYNQTVKLINKYNAYNDNIAIDFVDTQSSEFTAVAAKYSNLNLSYGDIIVSCEKADGNNRVKKIGFEDIYVLDEDETYAAYGMTVATISGNNIETALTSAIAYVLSDIETKVAILSGHSPADYTEAYVEMLESNNFEVTSVADTLITEIDNEYDIIVIPGPTKDFTESEINVISEFLDNDGNLGKGMMVFADATAPYLENFYDYLGEWGVAVEEGILFETDESNYMPDDPTTLGSYNSGADSELSDLQVCISGYNVPLQAAFEKQDYMAVGSIMETPETVVAAPKGTGADWAGADDYEKGIYSTVIESVKSNYDADDNEIETRVAVFSSVAFLDSEYNETASVSNKDVAFAMTERASGTADMGISFISKSITNESFLQTVSQSSADIIRIIFMFVLPIVIIVIGIVIYIKRRNA